MRGVDYAVENNTWIDEDRMVALGASYGGYVLTVFTGWILLTCYIDTW